MTEIVTSGSMSGERKRAAADGCGNRAAPQLYVCVRPTDRTRAVSKHCGLRIPVAAVRNPSGHCAMCDRTSSRRWRRLSNELWRDDRASGFLRLPNFGMSWLVL
jgi:hypothetical protein